jgi:hypothetical protein
VRDGVKKIARRPAMVGSEGAEEEERGGEGWGWGWRRCWGEGQGEKNGLREASSVSDRNREEDEDEDGSEGSAVVPMVADLDDDDEARGKGTVETKGLLIDCERRNVELDRRHARTREAVWRLIRAGTASRRREGELRRPDAIRVGSVRRGGGATI